MYGVNVYSLEEGSVVTECSIKTQEAVEMLDFEFCGTNVVNKIIMKVCNHLCVEMLYLLCELIQVFMHMSILKYAPEKQSCNRLVQ